MLRSVFFPGGASHLSPLRLLSFLVSSSPVSVSSLSLFTVNLDESEFIERLTVPPVPEWFPPRQLLGSFNLSYMRECSPSLEADTP